MINEDHIKSVKLKSGESITSTTDPITGVTTTQYHDVKGNISDTMKSTLNNELDNIGWTTESASSLSDMNLKSIKRNNK